MAKRMARGDSARRVGLVHQSQGLSNCSGKVVGGRWGALGRRPDAFLPTGLQPGSAWPNGWHDDIQRIEQG